MAISFRFLTLFTGLALATPLVAQYQLPLGDPDYLDAQENVFLEGEITYVTVTMLPADLQWLLNNPDTDTYLNCSVTISNSQINETHDNVGIRPRGNSQRDAKKNPWKLSFHEFMPGRRFHGLKKINLQSDSTDPSLSRSTTQFRMLRELGVPASRVHYVWLQINDGSTVSGVYVHHEQVDEIFLKAWFGNDDGRLYKCRFKDEGANLTIQGTGAPSEYAALEDYEEQNAGGDFLLLAEFIDFINTTNDATFAAEVSDWINVDGFLRAQATDMVTGQWDGMWIGGNNYYLYENTDTGRLEYIPWDLDHSFGMDYFWFPIFGAFGTNFATKAYQGWGNGGFGVPGNAPPPLIERLLDIPEQDNAMVHYSHVVSQGPFHSSQTFPHLDAGKALLGPIAFTGAFSGSTMDNGYDNGDFQAAFDSPGNYSAFTNPATWGLKPFIERRQRYVLEDFPRAIPKPRVYINELVADNETTLADEAGEFDDWVELYNDESFDVDLSGWSLSDNPGEVGAWEFPVGTLIPAKSYLLVWCDDDGLQGPLHASFKLSDNGETVHLWSSAASRHVMIDAIVFPELANDESYGRSPDGSSQEIILPVATPLASNNGPGLELLAAGNCPGPQTLHVSGATSGGAVYLLASWGSGSFTIPAGYPCAGSVLDLAGGTLRLLATVHADVNGAANLNITLPAGACQQISVQALDASACAISPRVSI